MFVATSRLYLTRDGRIVEEGDLDAHVLFVHAGGRVPFQLARRYGLVATPTPDEPPSSPVVAQPETQHVSEPPATKARRSR